jgi:hypothetical protein
MLFHTFVLLPMHNEDIQSRRYAACLLGNPLRRFSKDRHCLHGLFLAPKGDQILWIRLRVMVRDVDRRIAHVVDRGIVQDMVGRVAQIRRHSIRLAKTIFPDAG